MTLVEMLVATTAAVIIIGLIAHVFAEFARGVGNSRGLMELGSRMRTTALLLRRDLNGATAPLLPPLSPSQGVGYFEVIEGPRQDRDAAAGSPDLQADIDDLLLFTTRDEKTSFTGISEDGQNSGVIHGSTAEVAWFLRPTLPPTSPATYTLYRRQLLVVGQFGKRELDRANVLFAEGGLSRVYDRFDVSFARVDASGPGRLVPNTLSDLTRRERRFLHSPLDGSANGGFPHPFVANHQQPSLSQTQESLPTAVRGLIFDAASPRFGEDIVLTGVIAFDVRVFDPAAPIALAGAGAAAVVLSPGDDAQLVGGVANGAYVDLGNGISVAADSLPTGQSPRFSGYGHPLSGSLVGSATTRRTYDTWSTHYETNGIDEDGVSAADQGTNGLDDAVPARAGAAVAEQAADGVADDSGEMETSPPYPFPLRGIEIRIRCYDPASRQVRQVTVRHAFVPY